MIEHKKQGDQLTVNSYNKIVDHINAISKMHGNNVIAQCINGNLVIDGKPIAREGELGKTVNAINKVVRMPSLGQVYTNDKTPYQHDKRLNGTITMGTPVVLQHISVLWRLEQYQQPGKHSHGEMAHCIRTRPFDMICEKMSFWDMWDTDPEEHSLTHNNMPFMAPWSWGIALEDIEPGHMGRVQIDGVCLAKVLINEGVHHLEKSLNLRLCGSVIGGMNEALISSGSTADAIMLWGPTHKLYQPNQSRIIDNLASLETESLNLDLSKVGTDEDERKWPLALVRILQRDPVQTLVKVRNPQKEVDDTSGELINTPAVNTASGFTHPVYGNNIHQASVRVAFIPNPNYKNKLIKIHSNERKNTRSVNCNTNNHSNSKHIYRF